jgi:hypothetical protein
MTTEFVRAGSRSVLEKTYLRIPLILRMPAGLLNVLPFLPLNSRVGRPTRRWWG